MPTRRWLGLSCGVILIVSGLIRFYASLGDFWLDEIWTWGIAFSERVLTDWDILTSVHLDNNHYLNTWFFYLLGPDRHWVTYRIPSVLAGIGTVGVAGLIGKRHGRLEAFSAMLLTSGSYMLVHYSSEARGYGYVIFFALLSFYLLDRSFREKRTRLYFCFAGSAILGFLAHLEFVFCFAGLVSWSLWRLFQDREHLRHWMRLNLCCHLPPILFVGWLYLVDISRMAEGGGDILQLDLVLVELFSLILGGPQTGAIASAVALIAFLAMTAGIVFLWRNGTDEWLFHLMTIFVAPVVISVVMQQKYLYPRHFLVCWIFALLLVNHAMVQLVRWKPAGKGVFAVLLLAILAGNAIPIARLIDVGRGQYQAALTMISEQTEGPMITLGSDHPFRNPMLISFYQRRLPNLKPIAYAPREQWPETGTEWFIVHQFARDEKPDSSMTDGAGNRYQLAGEFPYAGLSGWKWAVYRNADFKSSFQPNPTASPTADR